MAPRSQPNRKKERRPGIRAVPPPRGVQVAEPAWTRRDRAIEADIIEALSAHTVLGRLDDVRLWVEGGVAHLRGLVRDESEQRLLRRSIGLVRGVFAVWDLVERQDRRCPMIVDIGCGMHKQAETAIGVDLFPQGPVEIVTDLEKGVPFAPDSLDHIFAVHVLEHVNRLVPLMNDIHRALRPDGVLHVMVPYWRNTVAVADPTHVRFFVPQSFRVFCEKRPGIDPYRPLMISFNSETVFADLSPDKEGVGARDAEIVRFFL